MEDGQLIAAAAVDWWARGIGAAGLLIALASTAIGAMNYRRGTLRVTVSARQSIVASAEGQADLALVTVAVFGRAVAVESIGFACDDQDVTGFGTSPAQALAPAPGTSIGGFPSFGFDSPQLPYRMQDGEAVTWAFRVAFAPWKVVESPPAYPFRAYVRLSDGTRVESNLLHLRLDSLPPPKVG